MSIELATLKYLDGDDNASLGQFASNKGYSDLIQAAKPYSALNRLVSIGASDDCPAVSKDLDKLIAAAPDTDIAETAKTLQKLLQKQTFVIVTRGCM